MSYPEYTVLTFEANQSSRHTLEIATMDKSLQERIEENYVWRHWRLRRAACLSRPTANLSVQRKSDRGRRPPGRDNHLRDGIKKVSLVRQSHLARSLLYRSDPSSSSYDVLLARTPMPFSNLGSLERHLRAVDKDISNAV